MVSIWNSVRVCTAYIEASEQYAREHQREITAASEELAAAVVADEEAKLNLKAVELAAEELAKAKAAKAKKAEAKLKLKEVEEAEVSKANTIKAKALQKQPYCICDPSVENPTYDMCSLCSNQMEMQRRKQNHYSSEERKKRTMSPQEKEMIYPLKKRITHPPKLECHYNKMLAQHRKSASIKRRNQKRADVLLKLK